MGLILMITWIEHITITIDARLESWYEFCMLRGFASSQLILVVQMLHKVHDKHADLHIYCFGVLAWSDATVQDVCAAAFVPCARRCRDVAVVSLGS